MRRQTFKVTQVEQIRPGTFKVTVDVGKGSTIRVHVYPAPLPWLIMSDDCVQWLASDLSDVEQKKILKACHRQPF